MRVRLGLVVCALAGCLGPWAGGASAQGNRAEAARAQTDLTRYVNPFSGTDAGAPDYGTGGGAANTSPAAVVPFGMLQWGPDSIPSSTNFAGGYTYGDKRLRGFSLTHMSGAGCATYQDVPFLPTTSPLTTSPVANSGDWNPSLVPSFSHSYETARPGYYQVILDPRTPKAIDTQLTATTRTGAGRFTYPPTRTAGMLINAGGSSVADGGASVRIDPGRQEVIGSATSGQFCGWDNAYTVYFAARFDHPFSAYGTWRRQTLLAGSLSNWDQSDAAGSAQTGAYLYFDTRVQPVVGVKVAISYISPDAARNNLAAEDPGWDFDGVRSSATNTWNAFLGRAQVSGGTRSDIATFYTALYHSLLAPHVFSDADGTYMGMDGEPHSAPGRTQYADFAGWDVYRSEIPLLALLDPARTSDMIRSLLADARDAGCLPKWPVANTQTDVMVGDSADPIIAGADAFGARGFDRVQALRDMIGGGTQDCQSATSGNYVERQGLADYLKLGYVPEQDDVRTGNALSASGHAAVWGSAATTLEYATDDFAIAALAARLADVPTARTFLLRSQDWRNLLNPATRYIQPRSSTGAFDLPFQPASELGFVEGSGAQYVWAVPHDLTDLFSAMGGPAAAAARLDAFFARLNAGPSSDHAFLGNEPTLEVPWEYDWLGQPYKTQRTVRSALLQLYDPSPKGYPGNDDLGEMSSWYVFGALGMYPEVPGTDILALGSPLFRRAVLHLSGGDLVIEASRASDRAPYVRRMTFNGSCIDQPWLRYAWLARGGHLDYGLSTRPDPAWGSAPAALPPSLPVSDQPVGPTAACPARG